MANKRAFFESGQGLVEYVLITALVVLAAVGIFRSFRKDLQDAYRQAGQQLVQGVGESTPAESGGE